MATNEFMVLTPAERMAMARDFVRDAEAAYYRIKLTPTADPSREDRVAAAKQRMDELHAEYEALAKEVDAG